MNIMEFTKIMKILTMSYGKEFDEDMLKIWYMQLKEIKIDIFEKAIMNIIKTNKFMPSIAEIIETSENEKKNLTFEILETMKKDNYFKTIEEYEKANEWLRRGIIPKWFKEDMSKYYKNMLKYNQTLLN